MKVNLKYWLLKCKEVWPLWEYWQRHNISLFSEHSHIPGSLSSCNLHTFSAPFQSSTLHEVTDGHLHYIPLAWVLQQLSIKLLFALRSPLLSIDDRRQQSPRSSPPLQWTLLVRVRLIFNNDITSVGFVLLGWQFDILPGNPTFILMMNHCMIHQAMADGKHPWLCM